MHFEETLEFEGDGVEIWKRVSAVKDIPNYWHGTRSLVVIGESGGMVRAIVKIAFGGSGEVNISTDVERRAMTIDYKSGPFTGRQTVRLSDGRIVATWDVKFRGIYRIASKWNEDHFRSGTAALARPASGRSGLPLRIYRWQRENHCSIGCPRDSEGWLQSCLPTWLAIPP